MSYAVFETVVECVEMPRQAVQLEISLTPRNRTMNSAAWQFRIRSRWSFAEHTVAVAVAVAGQGTGSRDVVIRRGLYRIVAGSWRIRYDD